MEDGVWRTIGGRRVYIKKGQSVSDAMKESGKFNKKTKKTDEELKKEIGNDVKKLQKYADEEGILPSELQDRLGIKDSDLGLEDDYTKEFEDQVQASQRYIKADEAKKQREAEFEKSVKEGYEKYHGKTDKEISDAKDDLKRKYMQIPEEERVKAYEEASNYMEDQFKAFDKGQISVKELEQAKKDSGLSKEQIEKAREYTNDRAPESYPKQTENKSGNTTSQAVPKSMNDKIRESANSVKRENADWIRKAFAQYKKEHPNTKKKLSDFKK